MGRTYGTKRDKRKAEVQTIYKEGNEGAEQSLVLERDGLDGRTFIDKRENSSYELGYG